MYHLRLWTPDQRNFDALPLRCLSADCLSGERNECRYCYKKQGSVILQFCSNGQPPFKSEGPLTPPFYAKMKFINGAFVAPLNAAVLISGINAP